MKYVRHTGGAAWGVGVLVSQTSDQRTYLFADGVKRSFKEAFCEKFIVPADAPGDEDAARLVRGAASGGTATPVGVHLELEDQIRARPDDPGPYLVYADWLQHKGDPRGDLITLQAKLAGAPDDKELRAAEAALLAEHRAYLLPESLDAMLRLPRRRTDPVGTRCEVRWRFGFLERARIARRAKQREAPELVSDLLRHPSAGFLRCLVIGPLGEPGASYVAVIDAIAKAKPARLAELVIGDAASEAELAFSTAGSLSALLSNLPGLERLDVRAGSLRFERTPKHARLRELALTAGELSETTLAHLFAAELPALETLELAVRGLAIAPHLLAKLQLADRAQLPKLRRLALRGVANGRAVEQALASSAFAQVELVLGDAPAANLAERRVIERAPDAQSVVAAQQLARADRWLALARDGERLWGEYEGSDHYYVYARTDTDETGCSCASPKDPCKHVLALLLIAARGHAFAERAAPAGLVRRFYERPRYGPTWE